MAPSPQFKLFAESSATLVGDVAYAEFKEKDLPVSVSEDSPTSSIVAAGQLSIDEAYEYIEATIRERASDQWYDRALLKKAQLAIDVRIGLESARELVEELQLERLLIDDSPYLEVRAAVDPFDDPTTHVDTFRAWFLGMFFVIIGTAINTFFAARQVPH
ncbi:hypothetical protein RQP46_002645 [Phenoliferia psychrophenolica]